MKTYTPANPIRYSAIKIDQNILNTLAPTENKEKIMQDVSRATRNIHIKGTSLQSLLDANDINKDSFSFDQLVNILAKHLLDDTSNAGKAFVTKIALHMANPGIGRSLAGYGAEMLARLGTQDPPIILMNECYCNLTFDKNKQTVSVEEEVSYFPAENGVKTDGSECFLKAQLKYEIKNDEKFVYFNDTCTIATAHANNPAVQEAFLMESPKKVSETIKKPSTFFKKGPFYRTTEKPEDRNVTALTSYKVMQPGVTDESRQNAIMRDVHRACGKIMINGKTLASFIGGVQEALTKQAEAKKENNRESIEQSNEELAESLQDFTFERFITILKKQFTLKSDAEAENLANYFHQSGIGSLLEAHCFLEAEKHFVSVNPEEMPPVIVNQGNRSTSLDLKDGKIEVTDKVSFSDCTWLDGHGKPQVHSTPESPFFETEIQYTIKDITDQTLEVDFDPAMKFKTQKTNIPALDGYLEKMKSESQYRITIFFKGLLDSFVKNMKKLGATIQSIGSKKIAPAREIEQNPLPPASNPVVTDQSSNLNSMTPNTQTEQATPLEKQKKISEWQKINTSCMEPFFKDRGILARIADTPMEFTIGLSHGSGDDLKQEKTLAAQAFSVFEQLRESLVLDAIDNKKTAAETKELVALLETSLTSAFKDLKELAKTNSEAARTEAHNRLGEILTTANTLIGENPETAVQGLTGYLAALSAGLSEDGPPPLYEDEPPPLYEDELDSDGDEPVPGSEDDGPDSDSDEPEPEHGEPESDDENKPPHEDGPSRLRP